MFCPLLCCHVTGSLSRHLERETPLPELRPAPNRRNIAGALPLLCSGLKVIPPLLLHHYGGHYTSAPPPSWRGREVVRGRANGEARSTSYCAGEASTAMRGPTLSGVVQPPPCLHYRNRRFGIAGFAWSSFLCRERNKKLSAKKTL
jgi:hypothetical protein